MLGETRVIQARYGLLKQEVESASFLPARVWNQLEGDVARQFFKEIESDKNYLIKLVKKEEREDSIFGIDVVYRVSLYYREQIKEEG